MAVTVSAVIPVYNAGAHIGQCLENLGRSRGLLLECIVVDDGSTDDSARIAKSFGATLLSTDGRKGPAFARNLGARAASGDIIFFIDADVCADEEAIERIQQNFARDPALDAVMGSYDEYPHCQDFLSQYRNLMHCFVHQNANREASTFWSGCGAIRRDVFFSHDGFDEAYGRPAIEDIELGYRLSIAGRKIILDKDLVVKHLKHWTFWNLVKTDIFDRGIPWTQLILQHRYLPNDLNVQIGQRISVALAFIIFGMATLLAIYWKGYFLTPLFTILFFLLSCFWVESAAPKSGPVAIAVGGIVAAIVGFSYWFHMFGLIPLVLLACILLYIRFHYYADSKKRRSTGLLLGLYLVMAVVVAVTYLPASALGFSFVSLLLVLVVLNHQFYLFLARRGWLFALAAIPFHLLFHFYNGVSFILGAVGYMRESPVARASRNDAAKAPLR